MKDYLEFTEEEFILDPAFRKWVESPDEASNRFWNNFLKLYPKKATEVTNARTILRSFRFSEGLSSAEKAAIWDNVKAAIHHEKEGKLVLMNPPKNRFKKFAPLAAAVSLGCIVFIGIKVNLSKSAEPATAAVTSTRYGEIKQLQLPDSSTITLNAHSQVRYLPEWNQSKREVWIDGEAFFSIKHTSRNELFIVHTSMFDIEVLGTEFNVSQRGDKIKISLNSGKIRLRPLDKNKEPLTMLPGELVEVSLSDKHLQKKLVKVENVSAWKEGKLLFDDTPLSDVIETLKETYGWQVEKVDDEILSEKISGEAEMKDERELINTLEKAMHIRIKKEGSKVYITDL